MMKFTVVGIDYTRRIRQGGTMKARPGPNAPMEKLPDTCHEIREVWLQRETVPNETYRPECFVASGRDSRVELSHIIVDERKFTHPPKIGDVFELRKVSNDL